MGKTLKGSTEHVGNIDLLTPEQKNFLSQSLGNQNTQSAGQSFGNFLQPFDPQQYEEMFQKSYIDPSLQALDRQIIPNIKQHFLGMDSSGSSAMNQALAQSATDVSSMLGSQYMNQYNQQQGNQLQALGLMGGLAGQQTFNPMVQQNPGILGPLIGAAGSIGGAGLSSMIPRPRPSYQPLAGGGPLAQTLN